MQVYVFPDGVEPELAERTIAMVTESDGRLWVRRGKSTFEEQMEYWIPWSAAVKEFGAKEAHKYCEVASYPSTSRHEEKRAKAVDVMCNEGDEEYRAFMFKRYGLWTPIASSPWHGEKVNNRGPIPA